MADAPNYMRAAADAAQGFVSTLPIVGPATGAAGVVGNAVQAYRDRAAAVPPGAPAPAFDVGYDLASGIARTAAQSPVTQVLGAAYNGAQNSAYRQLAASMAGGGNVMAGLPSKIDPNSAWGQQIAAHAQPQPAPQPLTNASVLGAIAAHAQQQPPQPQAAPPVQHVAGPQGQAGPGQPTPEMIRLAAIRALEPQQPDGLAGELATMNRGQLDKFRANLAPAVDPSTMATAQAYNMMQNPNVWGRLFSATQDAELQRTALQYLLSLKSFNPYGLAQAGAMGRGMVNGG